MFRSASPVLSNLQKMFLTEMTKNDLDTWLNCEKILNDIYAESPYLSESFEGDIKRRLSEVKNIMVLLLIRSKKIKVASSYSIYLSNPYEEVYTSIQKNQRCFSQLDAYLDKLQASSSQSLQPALQLILEQLSSFLVKQTKKGARPLQLKFLLRQITRYRITRQREVNTLINFMGRLQQMELQDWKYENNKKGIQIIKGIIEVLGEDKIKRYSGNLGVIFDEPCLSSQPRIAEQYINLNNDYLLTLDENQLQNIFMSLLKQSINYLCISFFFNVSRMLVEEEQFYKVRHLYENFVLSLLVRRAKCCKKPRIEDLVLKIAQYYVIGMWSHCTLGLAGLGCLLQNIEFVQSPRNQQRWLALAQVVSSKEDETVGNYFSSWLIKKKFKFDEDTILLLMKSNHTWQISSRAIKKHKKYPVFDSIYKGIINTGNQCYIISVVQALFMTKRLPFLLSKVVKPKRNSIVYRLKSIFQHLGSDRDTLPKVNLLKADGPEEFSMSESQEDSQNYLIRLFQMLEKELKQQKLLSQLQSIFQIQCSDTLLCKKCQYKTSNKQLQYVHTIPHTESFSLSYKEEMHDYICPKCNELNFTKTTELTLNSTILIVHINRFSFVGGETRKELPTKKIRRKIEGGYQLVGMVFHIGKRKECGHYVYYSRLQNTRWAEMNDQVVRQFELNHEDEQFQLDMKQQKTPYILFYKKKE